MATKPMSKHVDFSDYLFYYEVKLTHIRTERGFRIMTENEKELIKLIRENDNPTQALMTAAVIILGYIKQLESSSTQSAADLQVHA